MVNKLKKSGHEVWQCDFQHERDDLALQNPLDSLVVEPFKGSRMTKLEVANGETEMERGGKGQYYSDRG